MDPQLTVLAVTHRVSLSTWHESAKDPYFSGFWRKSHAERAGFIWEIRAKGKPLARVFDQYIYLADLKASSTKLSQNQADQLLGLIVGPLFDRYAKEKKITVTAKDIDDFTKGMNRVLSKSDFPHLATFGKG
jgi:hypothetical protein